MARQDFLIPNSTLDTEIIAVMARYGVVNPWLAAEIANLLAVEFKTQLYAAYDEAEAEPAP